MTIIFFISFRYKFNYYCNIRIKTYAREKYACNLKKKE